MKIMGSLMPSAFRKRSRQFKAIAEGREKVE